MKYISLFAAIFFTGITSVFGFGHEGHQAIADIARSRLNPAARAAVIRILGSDDLASVATWLDDVRSAGRNRGNMKGSEEAVAFNHRFPASANWHFVNFPVGSAEYDERSQFASDKDVVHAIDLAIRTLEGAAAGLTPLEALKVLVHCVGDVHQPLHCVSGYYDISNPSSPRLLPPDHFSLSTPTDAGGNALFYSKSQNLHELFDTTLLRRVLTGTGYKKLGEAAVQREAPHHSVTPGDYHRWSALWATEGVRLGTDAYQGLTFNLAETSPGRGGVPRLHRIEITLSAGYEAREAVVIARQIGEAGLRLAELLNSLHWSEP